MVVQESDNIVKTTLPGFTTNNTIIDIGTKEIQTKILLEGTAYGIHPDSTHTYTLQNATIKVKKTWGNNNGELELMIVDSVSIKTGTTDNEGKFSLRVPKIYEENMYYAVEVNAPNHHKKMLEAIEKNEIYHTDPLLFSHIYSGRQNEKKPQHLLHETIDDIYFYGVAIGGGPTQGGRGRPLAKWDTDIDGYARPRVWVQDNTPDLTFSEEMKTYITQWKDSIDAGVDPQLENDSAKAQVKIYFVDKDDPNIQLGNGQWASGIYGNYVDFNTNTLTGAVIYIWEGVAQVQPNNKIRRKALLLEELTQGMLNLHDVGISPYREEYFYGNNKDPIKAPWQPTITEKRNIYYPIKQLPKGW
jgi:hypothetical protein